MDGAIHVFAPENPLTGSGLFTSILTLQPHLIGSQGFYGGFWNLFSDHRTVIGYGYQGAMFQWSETPFSFTEDSLCHLQSLYLTPFFSGHSASSQARFLVTVISFSLRLVIGQFEFGVVRRPFPPAGKKCPVLWFTVIR